jgi:hypothetical protein
LKIKKPLKDELLLQGLSRGNFTTVEDPHSHTSFLESRALKKYDVEIRDRQLWRGPDCYPRGNCYFSPEYRE